MGINIHVYTVWGIRLDWDKELYDTHQDYIEGSYDRYEYGTPFPEDEDIPSLHDSMTGSMLIFGIVLYDSGDFRYMRDMCDYKEIPTDAEHLNELRQQYLDKLRTRIPDMPLDKIDQPWTMFSMIQYT